VRQWLAGAGYAVVNRRSSALAPKPRGPASAPQS
jgi:hypothetical protein